MPGRRRTPTRRDGPAVPIVTVCRGCCCGTDRKHPGVDHAGQVRALQDGLGDTARVRVTDCLDACERSNVVVVGPSPAGRQAGARPTWLAGVLHDDTITDIVDWVRDGGPGLAEAPVLVGLSEFTPTRKSRAEAGEV